MRYFDPKEATYRGFSEDFGTEVPLSITLQVTRRCNLKCIYCSELPGIPEPTMDEILSYARDLRGIERVIVSGGEPTLRGDLPDILQGLRRLGFPVLSLASNATLVTPDLAMALRKTLDYVDVTIDGTQAVHNEIRGQFDSVIHGARMLRNAGLPLCIVTVLIQKNRHTIPEILKLANELNALRVKIISPIPKGRGQSLGDQVLASQEIASLHEELSQLKQESGWSFSITITDWAHVREGHALLVHPDGEVVASPVPDSPGCVRRIGRVPGMDAKEIWDAYPYKENHIQKYFDRSLFVC